MRLGTLPGQQGGQGPVPAEPELARGRPTCRIATDCEDPCGDGARAKSYGQVLREYRRHREDKFNSPDGQRCRCDAGPATAATRVPGWDDART